MLFERPDVLARAGRRIDPPAGMESRLDLAYGEAAAQRLDVYRPAGAQGAALLFVVHGGGWQRGDKGQPRLIGNKVRHWGGRGLVVVSANYRVLPEADPATQADDVARALAWVQARCGAWGGDPARIVLMGHSAGAHLVSLLSTDRALAARCGVQGWLGTVAVDSAAFDVERIMRRPHLGLYDLAFGADPAFWREVSPMRHLESPPVAPMLLVCSTRRPDACEQAREFAARARALGGRVELVELALSHAESNEQVGLPGACTDAIDAFMHSLGSA